MSHQHLNNVGLQIYTRRKQRRRNLLGSASMHIVTIDRWGSTGRAVGKEGHGKQAQGMQMVARV